VRDRETDTTDGLFASLRQRWATRREEFARFRAAVDGAQLCDELLADLDAAVHQVAEEALTLSEAAALSGYTADHLGRLLRQGKIPNVGRRHAPRIRRVDLPLKAALLPDHVGSHIVSGVRGRIARAVVHSE
jgi:hypothetical protein